jgi:hypothetical protein
MVLRKKLSNGINLVKISETADKRLTLKFFTGSFSIFLVSQHLKAFYNDSFVTIFNICL